jgi:hypothetical protein
MSDTQVSLNVTDIADAVKVIDYAAEQGAFKGWENIRQIMKVRDRLEAFTVSANAQVNTPAPVLTEAVMPANPPSRRMRQQRKD